RILTSVHVSSAPFNPILYYPTRCSQDPFPARPPILSLLRRPNSAHHLYSPKGRVRWRARSRLSELEKGEEGLFVFNGWWGRCSEFTEGFGWRRSRVGR